jgi:hypothetical protein
LTTAACLACLALASGSVTAQVTRSAAKPKPLVKPLPSGPRIYKWTDDKGVVHYGEVIPPEYRDHAADEMNQQGLTLRRIEATATPEQRKAFEERLAVEREEKKRAFELRRRDLALTHTYSSAEEIDVARDRNLALPLQAIRGLEPRIQKAQQRLQSSQERAESLVKSGKPVPEALQDELDEHKLDLNTLLTERGRHESQIVAIKERFEAARRRYVELTQTPVTATR